MPSRCEDTDYIPPFLSLLADNIYVFEGQDYSKVTAESDKQAFDQLLANRVEELECGPRERVLRSENKACSWAGVRGCTCTSVCVHVCVQL